MIRSTLVTHLTALALSWAAACSVSGAEETSAEQFLGSLDWSKGPAEGQLGEHAAIAVPAGFVFTGSKDTQRLMEAFGNIVSGTELGLLAPEHFLNPSQEGWFVVFEFSDVGYVKDDEKDSLDAEAMLDSIKRGTAAANQERQRMGATPLKIVGWHTQPHYDPESNNLEWCVEAESDGEAVLNYNTRILGRRGVMEVTLVLDPKELDSVLPKYKELLAGYGYNDGHRYAEYRQGDKVAKYGLAALVVGAAAAGAAKLGLFAALAVFLKKAWKLIVLGLVGIATFFRRLIFGRERRVEGQ